MSPNTTQITVRFPDDVIAAVDTVRRKLAEGMLTVSPDSVPARADAIRLLVTEALQARGMLPNGDKATVIASLLRKGSTAKKIVTQTGCKPSDVEWVRARILKMGESIPGDE